MLTWDEEVKPTPQMSIPQGSPLSHLGQVPSQTPPVRILDDGAVVSSAIKPAVKTPHRVNAADKRIINGKTDVNQLVPFKYKWAWENTWPVVPITGCRKKST